jgi:hypothetical protein
LFLKARNVLVFFHKKKNTSDGHRNECKECVKDIQKKYKEAPGFKEKQKEYDKIRYEENRDKILERKKQYHIENQEKILSYKKVYREENKEKIKIWRQNNMNKFELRKDISIKIEIINNENIITINDPLALNLSNVIVPIHLLEFIKSLINGKSSLLTSPFFIMSSISFLASSKNSLESFIT